MSRPRARLHIVHQRAREAHRLRSAVQRLLPADLQFVFKVQVARREEHVNARPVRKLHRARCHLDVFLLGARQRCDPRLANCLRDCCNCRKVAFRCHRKASLNDVHAQVFERVRHGQLFLRGHAAARRLLAVAQSGIEEGYVVCGHETHLREIPPALSLLVSRILPHKAKLFFLWFRLKLLIKTEISAVSQAPPCD